MGSNPRPQKSKKMKDKEILPKYLDNQGCNLASDMENNNLKLNNMCKSMCKKSLQRQEVLFKKMCELTQMENERDKIWDMPFIYQEERLMELDQQIILKQEEISMLQKELSLCKCYQERQLLQGLTYKKAG